jgi:hypothetical protein
MLLLLLLLLLLILCEITTPGLARSKSPGEALGNLLKGEL